MQRARDLLNESQIGFGTGHNKRSQTSGEAPAQQKNSNLLTSLPDELQHNLVRTCTEVCDMSKLNNTWKNKPVPDNLKQRLGLEEKEGPLTYFDACKMCIRQSDIKKATTIRVRSLPPERLKAVLPQRTLADLNRQKEQLKKFELPGTNASQGMDIILRIIYADDPLFNSSIISLRCALHRDINGFFMNHLKKYMKYTGQTDVDDDDVVEYYGLNDMPVTIYLKADTEEYLKIHEHVYLFGYADLTWDKIQKHLTKETRKYGLKQTYTVLVPTKDRT